MLDIRVEYSWFTQLVCVIFWILKLSGQSSAYLQTQHRY